MSSKHYRMNDEEIKRLLKETEEFLTTQKGDSFLSIIFIFVFLLIPVLIVILITM